MRVAPSFMGLLRQFVGLICSASVISFATRVQAALTPEWHVGSGFRWAVLDVPKTGHAGFTLLSTSETGIGFTNTLAEEEGAANRLLWNGSGVALGDYDQDGLPDIFLCGLDTPNALYKNLGNWKFTNVTRQAGLERSGRYFRGAVFADVNGDGWLDLLISTTGQGVLCYLNDGHGHFADETARAGTASHFGSVTLALADVDGNGTLDLYITNYRTSDIRDRSKTDISIRQGQLVIPPQLRDRLFVAQGRIYEYGEPDQLLLNDGKGRFTAVSWTMGTFLDEEGLPLSQPPRDWGLTASFRDLNGDSYPDLYVCNDFWSPDRIWLNDGHGTFRAAPALALRHTSASSMGVDFADIDRDGNVDFFVLDMLSRNHRLRRRQMFSQRPAMAPPGMMADRPQIMRNTLFLNRGDGTFAEIADFAGVDASDWSWSPHFVDVDLDGYEDLLIAAGHAMDVQDFDANAQIKVRPRSYSSLTNDAQREQEFTREKMLNSRLYPRLNMPIIALRNSGHLHFEETTAIWGTDQLGVHQGMAMADLDNDGDLDLVVNNLGSAAGIYRNDTCAPRVAVRLKGAAPNTQGIGAKIRLLNGAVPLQSQEAISGGRYLSGSDPMFVFAAGQAIGGMTLEVVWRRGRISRIENVGPNRIYEVDEASAIHDQTLSGQLELPTLRSHSAMAQGTGEKPGEAPFFSKANPLFADVSKSIGHLHFENQFDDFALEPLLPRRFSQLGPGVAWSDLNGDGHDDLILGSGKGGNMAVFYGDGTGHFKQDTATPLNLGVGSDQTGIVVLLGPDQTAHILVGSASYEEGIAPRPPITEYDWGARTTTQPLLTDRSSTGPLALADIDGDGDLDLFVGGRILPGRWPEKAISRIYRNDAGRWSLDLENSKALEPAGLVSGAVFTDLDGDGLPELILACEWGVIRVFRNDGGRLQDQTEAWGLAKLTGWWNGVAVGDLNGDGKLDLIASNWGLNSPYHATAQHPVRVYFGMMGGLGPVDILEASFDPELGAFAPVRNRDSLAMALPWLPEKWPTHKAFSEASVEQILGERLLQVESIEANTLSSMAFLNRGDHFEPIELPAEAQFAPAYAITVADFDGDGDEDVFLSQNFFATGPHLPRLDAGRGLLLRGDGTGKLTAIPGQASGVLIYGEQRGAAAADFNEDGRMDLVVTQNGAPTHLFQNMAGKPGLRVRLHGLPSNPSAIGAVVRLRFGNRMGPAHEIHSGSGYWSQDSPIMVLGTPQPPTGIVVRWPGGGTTQLELPRESKEITVTQDEKAVRP